MIDSWTVYWISRLDTITCILSIMTFVFSILFLFVIVVLLNEMARFDEDMYRCSSKVPMCIKIIPIIFLPIFLTLTALVPTTKEMCAVIIIPKIVNNEKLHDVGDKFYNLAMDWMEELSPTKKEKQNEKK